MVCRGGEGPLRGGVRTTDFRMVVIWEAIEIRQKLLLLMIGIEQSLCLVSWALIEVVCQFYVVDSCVVGCWVISIICVLCCSMCIHRSVEALYVVCVLFCVVFGDDDANNGMMHMVSAGSR